jgi:hypothetical protein
MLSFLLHYSPYYPTFSYLTFHFMQPAMSEGSILSTANSACSTMNHTSTPHTLYILPTQFLYCTGMTLSYRKGRRLRSKYPLLISSINKLFYLQIYIMLKTILFVRYFHLMLYSIFFIINIVNQFINELIFTPIFLISLPYYSTFPIIQLSFSPIRLDHWNSITL